MQGAPVTDASKAQPARAAVHLLRAARAAALATSDAGQPFASLVTPATAWDGSVLMLLSGLSPHTRHLRADPRCSLLVTGPAPEANPQTAPRLTIVGAATPESNPALKGRWLALHPYAAFYAELPDFSLWRLRPERGHFIGGFASAHRFQAAELVASQDGAAALEAAEPDIMEHCNNDHPDAMDAIAAAHGGDGDGWRMVGCDPDGCDLARGDNALRIAWSNPVSEPSAVRAELVELVGTARRLLDGPTV